MLPTHRILEEVTKAAKMAVKGMSIGMVEIYNASIQDLDKKIALYGPSIGEDGGDGMPRV
jgi:hypothetical protein